MEDCVIFDLVTAQRQLNEAERILKSQIGQVENAGTGMKTRWLQLKAQLSELRNRFINSNDFIQDCYLKQERARLKILKATEEQQKLTSDIQSLKEEVDLANKIKSKLNVRLMEYKIYQEYLAKVCAKAPQFKSIADILNRYECLEKTINDLTLKQIHSLTAEYEVRAKINEDVTARQEALMNYEAQLAIARERAEEAKSNVAKWITVLSHIQAIATQKTLELNQVKASSWNVYKDICKVKSVPIRVSETDTQSQLLFITKLMLENKKVLALVRDHVRKINHRY